MSRSELAALCFLSALAMVAPACTPDFDALQRGDVDAGAVDAAGLDAAGIDAARADAGPFDASRPDAGATDAAALDASPDACVSSAEVCDGDDDDCDGVTDEGSPCAMGTTCRAAACRAPSGTLLWGRVLASEPAAPVRARDRGRAVVSLGPGGAAIVGDFEEGALHVAGTFTRAPLAQDAFLASFTRSGAVSGAFAIGGAGFDEGLSLGAPPAALVAGGTAVGTVNFGGGDTTGGTSGFTARYGSASVASFVGVSRAATLAAVIGIAPLGDGVVSVGRFSTTFDAGAPCAAMPGPSSGGSRGFVVRYGADSAPRWCATFGGSEASQINAVAVNAAGDRIAVIGGFLGMIDLPSGTATSVDPDVFVVVLDADGLALWSTTVSGAGSQEGTSIAFLPGGDLIIGGSYAGATTDAAGMTLPSSPFQRGFIARIDGATHAATWTRVDVGAAGSTVRALAAFGDVIAVHGEHNGIRLAGCSDVPIFAGSDLFVARLAATDGACVWMQSVGGPGAEVAGGVAVDADRIYVAASVDDGVIIDGSTVTTLGDDASGRDTDAVLLAFER